MIARDNMDFDNVSCPHIGNHVTTLEVKKLEIKSCFNCEYAGPNLWICLQKSCLRVGCSNHSTEHFQARNTHCLHMNISSFRSWCYVCEREVFLDVKEITQSNLFSTVKLLRSRSLSTTKNEDSDNEMQSHSSDDSGSGLVGLQNLANTCYMNSALQALSNVNSMTYYFLNCADLVEHTVEQSTQRNKAGLAKCYQRLMKDIWSDNRVFGKDYIAPRGILYGIRSVHPMFRGFQQHDTQEFLRCFMDQLHEELKENTPISPALCNSKATNTNEKHHESSEEDSAGSASSSPSRSGSFSESEYETCDSNVSEQSSIFRGPLHSRTAIIGGRRLHKTTTAIDADHSSGGSQYQTQSRSIISDIFDGKILSSVQCLTCDRISTREETFQDLSLPIPNRDYLNVLHQTHSLSAQSLNSVDSTSARNGSVGGGVSGNWLSWMWNIIRSWLWGPSVTLYDCMASFFSADELKGDNMYSCEKCNKLRTGLKYSQILDLPEVLCIHLKRFRHDLLYSSKISSYVQFPLEGFDMRPYLHKDCKSNVATYSLVSVICHHGTVGGGHYTCYAQNVITSRWYEYDDQRVTEVAPETVQNCQAYVLFYRKNNPQMDLIRAEASDLAAANPVHVSNIRFYVSRDWLYRFNTFSEPGPINNWAILCPHGGLLQSKIALLSKIAVPISQPLWDFLYYKFGGGPAINMLFECEVCKRAAEALVRRQNYEYGVFTKYNGIDADLESDAIFAISMPWLRKWQQFVRGLTCKEPGPITNTNIAASAEATQNPSSICNVRLGSDYAQLNTSLWRFLHGIYGGGPEIILRGSLNEEIEIIDQDEYDDSNSNENLDLSDTESNIGQCKSNLSDKRETPQTKENSTEGETEEDWRRPQLETISNSMSSERKESKHSKHYYYGSKKQKSSTLRSNLRKRTIRGRNAMKNTDFFGPKGSYSQHKSSEELGNNSMQNPERHSKDDEIKQSNAFSDKTRQAFHNEFSPQRSQLQNKFEERVTVTLNRKRIKNKNSRRSDILLQKFSQLGGSNEMIETDT